MPDPHIPPSWKDLTFWFATLGAALFRLMVSPQSTFFRSLLLVLSAVFFAMVFTEPTLEWLGLSRDSYLLPISALISLTGEHLARFVITTVQNPASIFDLLDRWRGRK